MPRRSATPASSSKAISALPSSTAASSSSSAAAAAAPPATHSSATSTTTDDDDDDDRELDAASSATYSNVAWPLAARVRDSLRRRVRRVRDRVRHKYDELKEKVQEKREEPSYIKLADKIAFTLSFLAVCVCQYFLLNSPNEYWMFYTIVTPLLMVYRIIYFRSQDMQYFLLDFCYFSLLLSLANLHLLPASATLFKVCFIFSNGPVMLAIIVWRCSFVFHDYDKQTSVYIHFLPGMLYYTWRWHHPLQSAAAPELCAVDYAIAVGFYLVWQVGYYICTETHWGSRAALDANPKLLTSLRWLAQDHKNATAVGVLRLCRAIGVFAPTEKYDARTVKTKVVFCAAQLAFTVVCFAPTPLLYYSQRAHLAYLILVFTTSLYSGASFYIEIFSQRYHVALVQKAEALRLRREGSAADLHAALAVAGAAASEAGGGSSANKSMPLLSPSLSSSAKSHDSDASLSSLGSNSGASEDD